MRMGFAAAILASALAGCVPTMTMAAGDEHDRMVEVVRQFCAAERSADPFDSEELLVESVADMLARTPFDGAYGKGRNLTSGDPAAGCEPGRTSYRGGSRSFAEVRLGGRTDRLEFWRGTGLKIHNILYGRSRVVAGRKVDNLRAGLMAELAAEAARPAPPAPVLPDSDCLPGHFTYLATDTNVFRQGATMRITPTVDVSPAGTRELPLKCVGGWTLEGPATLAPDRKSFSIAPDAPIGSMIRITFEYEGKPVAAAFRVIGRDEVVLTGRYSQKSVAGCEGAEAVRELEFGPGGRFSVTFTPFETYRDYWGTYEFDPATKRLELKVEGGNFVPSGLDLSGEAELLSGSLTLRGLFLGSRNGPPQENCTYTF